MVYLLLTTSYKSKMGLFDFLKQKKTDIIASKTDDARNAPYKEVSVENSPASYVDASSVSPDEKSFYQPDDYYTYYSYSGSMFASKVITFDERKRTSYPSARGLYVAEIMLLEYCNQGNYPKPEGGYPGFWWFEYGIRDVGHALESLERRGFIQWMPKASILKSWKVEELKSILSGAGLPEKGRKVELIDRIVTQIPEQELDKLNVAPKYELTELGKNELEDNGYVPYMHRHSHRTIEDNLFGEPFTVWNINKLFSDGNATNWRKIVGSIEEKRFGVNMANASSIAQSISRHGQAGFEKRDEMRAYLASKQAEISLGITMIGDGFLEESRGLDYKSVGKDKEALIQFYIAIGKRFDAPALYRETAVLLRKYKMYEEELEVIDEGLKNVSKDNRHWKELKERKTKVQELIRKKH